MSSTDQHTRQQLVIAEASLVLRQGAVDRSRERVSSLLSGLDDPTGPAAGATHRWPWLRGLSEMGIGRDDAAVEELAEASRRARAELGPLRPDLARIGAALAIARGRAARGMPDGEAAALWRKVDPVLRSAFPAPHPMSRYLEGLGGPVRSERDAIRMAARAPSRPLPDVFVP
ncbi:MAG: hypothetical protein ACK5F5_11870 [Gammaproteobacteria bacterium]|jgi:hypothetical protein